MPPRRPWSLDALGNVIDSGDIVFARSTDYGQTWQTTFMVGPARPHDLNDDNHGQTATGRTRTT